MQKWQRIQFLFWVFTDFAYLLFHISHEIVHPVHTVVFYLIKKVKHYRPRLLVGVCFSCLHPYKNIHTDMSDFASYNDIVEII